jgi:hypothetical protein
MFGEMLIPRVSKVFNYSHSNSYLWMAQMTWESLVVYPLTRPTKPPILPRMEVSYLMGWWAHSTGKVDEMVIHRVSKFLFGNHYNSYLWMYQMTV